MVPNAPSGVNDDRRRLLAGIGIAVSGNVTSDERYFGGDGTGKRDDSVEGDVEENGVQPSTIHRDWPALGFDAANTGYNPQTTGPTERIRVKWRSEEFTNAPVVADGTVYAGGAGRWANGDRVSDAVYALDAETGRRRWQTSFEDVWFERPAVVGTTVYVFGSEDVLYALDTATGEERWRYVDATNVGHLRVADGTVYAGGHDRLVALDSNTGDVRWQYATDGPVYRPLAVAGGCVFVNDSGEHWPASGTAYLRVLDAETGELVWSYDYPDDCDAAFAAPTVGDGVVYVGGGSHDYGDGRGRVVALDTATGNERWSRVVDQPMNEAMALAHGILYVPVNGSVVALDAADGSRRWQFSLDPNDRNTMDNVDRYSPPAVVGDTVYVGGYDAALYALDAKTGERKWAYAFPGRSRAASQPAVVDGTVYVACGRLYALAEAGGAGVSASYVMQNGGLGSPRDLRVGREIQFWANLSRGPITEYAWDFTGDGSVDETGKFVTRTYESPGKKSVTLRASGDDGRTDAMQRTFEVAPRNGDA